MSGRDGNVSAPGLRHASAGRPRAIALVALWLGFSAVVTGLYAGFVPLLPPIIPRPEPAVSTALGVLGILAAVGVWQERDWGRWLGVGVAVVMAVRDAALAVAPEGTDGAIGLVLGLALDLLVLGILLLRWPSGRT